MDGDRELEGIVERLNALPTEAASGTDGWPDLVARLEARNRVRTWRRAAAAIVIFGAGAAGGFFLRPAADAPEPGTMDEALALAAEVQRTGSEYIAALAAFAAVVDSLSNDARSQGRDAAIATLFGAASELAALTGEPDGWVVPVRSNDRGRVRF